MSNRPVHFEIHAKNPTRAAAFYAAVFGWQFLKVDGPKPYWVVNTGEGDGIIGGLMVRQGDPPDEGQAVNAFVLTMQVDSVADTLADAVRHGGREAVARFAVPGVGWIGYAKDPDGNIFGLHQPDEKAE
jgi:predicted enzyme related to lactoylglutathione lyase